MISTSPANLLRVSTRSIEKAADFLQAVYGAQMRPEFNRDGGTFFASFTGLAVGDMRLVSAKVTGLKCLRYSETMAQIVVPLQGHVTQRAEDDRASVTGSRNCAAVVRPFRRTQQDSSKGAGLVLSIPVALLRQRYEDLCGRAARPADIDMMAKSVDLKSRTGAALFRTMTFAMPEMMTLKNSGLSAVAGAAYADILSGLATAALFEGIADRTETACGGRPPQAILQARDYIEAHAHEAISLSQLASSLGIGTRSMQANFQRYFGLSARDFLLDCRLERARAQLMTPDDSMPAITAIAYGCGFADLSHFARKYRTKFGELPSDTLRTSLMQRGP